MKLNLFTMLSALSLLLCVGTCVVWVRSSSHWDSIILRRGPDQLLLYAHSGKIWLKQDGWPDLRATEKWEIEYEVDHFGFGRKGGLENRYSLDDNFIVLLTYVKWRFIPIWFPCMILAIMPAIRILRLRTARSRAGVCAICGYDLRASPERCPECGTDL